MVLFTAFILAVILAGFFAGAETGMYQLSRVRLRLGVEHKRFSYVLLSKSMRDGSALLLTLLIGTNLSHYIVTSIVTFIMLDKFASEHSAELFATFLTAPVLFVFTELIPKSLFYRRADSLMPSVSFVIFIFHKLFVWCGAVPLLKLLTKALSHLRRSPATSMSMLSTSARQQLGVIVQETQDEGFFSQVQSDIVNRLVNIPEVSVRRIMTTIDKVESVEVNTTRAFLFQKLKDMDFTRLLVYEGQPSNVIGWVNIYQVLTAAEDLNNLRDYIKPIRRINPDTDVISSVRIMQREKHKILLVSRITRSGKQASLGIVTMKDLAEELLGELSEW